MDAVRRFPRTNVVRGYCISFRIGGQVFADLPLVSLGTGGCSLVAPESLVERSRKFQILEDVRLQCKSLPAIPFKARVAWVSGCSPSCLGMNFLDLPPDLAGFLEALVHGIQHETSSSMGQ
jgi:hypothetical protein